MVYSRVPGSEQGGSVTFEVGETKKEDTLVIEADLIWTIETIQAKHSMVH